MYLRGNGCDNGGDVAFGDTPGASSFRLSAVRSSNKHYEKKSRQEQSGSESFSSLLQAMIIGRGGRI